MIDDPPLLTIRREFARPSPAQLAAFAGVPTGYVIDALGGRGALAAEIRPLPGIPPGFSGPILTCACGPADNLALFGAVSVARPGDAIFAATDAFAAVAVAGDLLIGMAKNASAIALVTDGLVRDQAGIRGVGLPVHCAGVSPNSPARNGPGEVGTPIVIGGVAVSPGDIAVADEDGVVVVPFARIDATIERLAAVRAAEASLEAKVKAGLTVPDFVRALIDSGRFKDAP
jgi:4-hydroxy-4-methyl-2-oxoglutarate aldolase